MNNLQRHQREIDTQRAIIEATRKWPEGKEYRTAQRRLNKLLSDPMYQVAIHEAMEVWR